MLYERGQQRNIFFMTKVGIEIRKESETYYLLLVLSDALAGVQRGNGKRINSMSP